MAIPYALRCLRHRNLRLFFAGQCVSLVGTWMQSVAQAWLVYRLTHSSELLGLVGFLGQVPVFVLGLYAGSLADRLPRRRLVILTQCNALAQASLLAAVTLGGVVQVWHVLVLAGMLGLTYAFEIPARQALLADIAGSDLPNAVALNSSIVNATRVIGPGLAGYVVAAVGEGWCFALNAASFVGTIAALVVMKVPPRPPLAHPRPPPLEALSYARRTPLIGAILALIAVSSFFALPYTTLLPVFAADVLGGGATRLGTLHMCAGVGALTGALGLLFRGHPDTLPRRVPLGATALGAGLVGLALSRAPLVSEVSLVLAGFGFITQMAGTMTLLQHLAPDALRGRLIGLFSTLFVGVTPFGALAAGAIAHHIGAPRTVLGGAMVTLLASAAVHAALPALRRASTTQRT